MPFLNKKNLLVQRHRDNLTGEIATEYAQKAIDEGRTRDAERLINISNKKNPLVQRHRDDLTGALAAEYAQKAIDEGRTWDAERLINIAYEIFDRSSIFLLKKDFVNYNINLH